MEEGWEHESEGNTKHDKRCTRRAFLVASERGSVADGQSIWSAFSPVQDHKLSIRETLMLTPGVSLFSTLL